MKAATLLLVTSTLDLPEWIRYFENFEGTPVHRNAFVAYWLSCYVLIELPHTTPPPLFPDHIEKVYNVSETPTQHKCGVSRTNEKLTNRLKITTHQFKLFKIKKYKYSLNFQSPPSKQHFPFFENQNSLSISALSPLSLLNPHSHCPLPNIVTGATLPDINSFENTKFHYPATLPFPILQNSKSHLSLFISHHHTTPAPPSSLSQLQTLTAAV